MAKTFRDCVRCRGTGSWKPGQVCFGCNGEGRKLNVTPEIRAEGRAAHVAEVEGMIAAVEAQLAACGPRSRRGLERDLAKHRANLGRLQAEDAS
jgi:hypothetical protein